MAGPQVVRIIVCIEVLLSSAAILWAEQNSTCDVNRDGKVDVLDVQLITNMEIGVPGFPCTANIGGVLGCSDAARHVVLKASLGQGCHFNFLSWKPIPSPGIMGYYIYRSASPDGKSATLLNPGKPWAGTSYADVEAATGSRYFYFVKAAGTMGPDRGIEPSVKQK